MATNRIPILVYHALVEKTGPALHPIHITANAFRAQVAWLHRNNYSTLTIDELLSGAANGTGKYCVLTFDDGYQSVLDTALPCLEQFGYKATLFACTGPIGQTYATFPNIELHTLPPGDRPLTWPELNTLVEKGWSVQAHSVSHADHSLLNEDKLIFEMDNCRQVLEQHLGQAIKHYAYPFGRYNSLAIVTAKKQRYTSAATVHPGMYAQGSDPFRLPRILINRNDNLRHFQRKVETGFASTRQHLTAMIRSWLFSNPQVKDRFKKIAGKWIN